ncbi:MAG TPA: hypothetical protein PLO07_17550, partial [Rubrivivax sp.]|nr:hypothetical protein [Rubrivivax sp.]
LLLPAPPVPVMPSTGMVVCAAAAARPALSSAEALPFSSAVMACDSARQASACAGAWPTR